jgi:uncharacterized damage-inducible protein DinB
MKMTEFFLAQLEREITPTRRALAQVPEGRNDWRPHPRSMQLGYLAALVASMPGWVAMMIDNDEFDIKPAGSSFALEAQPSSGALAKLLDESAAKARRSLENATDERLLQPWRMLVGGHVVREQIRHIAITDGVFSHLAHHRGQLTVYLRLNEAKVPAIYGPTADEGAFPS